jgi:hypothetical protein
VQLLAERCGVSIGRSYLSELERRWQQDKMPTLEVAIGLAEDAHQFIGRALE